MGDKMPIDEAQERRKEKDISNLLYRIENPVFQSFRNENI
jgi:hypothetical protein